MSLESVLSHYMEPNAAREMAEKVRASAKRAVECENAKIAADQVSTEPAHRIHMRALGFHGLTVIDRIQLRRRHTRMGALASNKDLLTDSE